MERPYTARDWHLKGIACLLVTSLICTGIGFWIAYAVTPLRVEGEVTNLREDWTGYGYVRLNDTQDFHVSDKVFAILNLGDYVVLSSSNAGRDLTEEWHLDSVGTK